jgi:predicted peroxiredoxin
MLKKILTKYKSFSGSELSLYLQKKVLDFFAMDFVSLFHQKNKEKTKSSLLKRD